MKLVNIVHAVYYHTTIEKPNMEGRLCDANLMSKCISFLINRAGWNIFF